MFRIIGREILDGGRKGRFIVEFSREWPRNAKKIYLIGEFTSLYPGYCPLRRIGNRGFTYVKLWSGTYGYGFIVDNDFANTLDPDNGEKICFRNNFHPDQTVCLSKVTIPRPSELADLIYHWERDPSCLSKFYGYVVLRLRTSKGVYKPVLELNGVEYEPQGVFSLGEDVVYQYIVEAEKKEVLRYKFRLDLEGKTMYYGYEGLHENPSPIIVDYNEIPGVESPKWFMGTIYYQIFVDSFYNGDPTNDPPIKITKTAPREYGFYGGDLRGIIEKINYLLDLGVETIYLTPIFKSTSYHRYDVIDYYKIDPYLGSDTDFQELIEKMHAHGLKLILDITLNHCNPCHEYFKDVLLNWDKSRYWSWFNVLYRPPENVLNFIKQFVLNDCRVREIFIKIRENPDIEKWFRENKPFYETFFHVWTMVKFNHDNPETVDYFVKVAKYWMERGVDGFRIDVAMGINRLWLKEFYSRVKSINNDFLILAEVSEHPAIYYDVFDSVMNYHWRRIILEKTLYDAVTIDEFIDRLNDHYMSLPHYKAISMYNLLGSHDTPRIKTLVNNNKELLKLLIVLQFTLPGSPVIYYGDEIGMDGGKDPDCRRPMVWNVDKWDLELRGFVKTMVNLYKKNPVLRYGFYSVRKLGEEVIEIKRWLRGDEVIAIINLNRRETAIKVDDLNGRYINLLNGETVELANGVIRLGNYGFLILRKLK